MKRFRAVTDARLSDGAEAAKVVLQFTDGTSDTVEIVRGSMRDLLRPLLAISKAFGDRVPNSRPLPETVPADAIVIPAEELAVRKDPGGGVWLMLRVGSHDLAVAFPERRAVLTLARALVNSPR